MSRCAYYAQGKKSKRFRIETSLDWTGIKLWEVYDGSEMLAQFNFRSKAIEYIDRLIAKAEGK